MTQRAGHATAGLAPHPLRGVLFDLDGTLVDTVADIRMALNRTLNEIGCNGVSLATTRDLIGRGAPALIARALERQDVDIEAEVRERLHERFVVHYHAIHERHESAAVAFPGAHDALAGLRAAGLGLGVVTNKQRSLAVCTLEAVGLARLVNVILGGDSCARRKPHPDPLLSAAEALGVIPPETLVIGDSINDVTAARAAGMAVWCVPYGYNEGQDPRLLPCDAFIESLAELPELLRGARAELAIAAPREAGPPTGNPAG